MTQNSMTVLAFSSQMILLVCKDKFISLSMTMTSTISQSSPKKLGSEHASHYANPLRQKMGQVMSEQLRTQLENSLFIY